MDAIKSSSTRIEWFKSLDRTYQVKGINANPSKLTERQKSSVSPDDIEDAEFSELLHPEPLTSIDIYT